MPDKTVEVVATPGTSNAYLTSLGGTTGDPAASYPLTQIAGYYHTITVAEDLVGRFYVGAGNIAGDNGFREVEFENGQTEYPLNENPTVDVEVTPQSVREGITGRWTDERGNYFDLTVTDTPAE